MTTAIAWFHARLDWRRGAAVYRDHLIDADDLQNDGNDIHEPWLAPNPPATYPVPLIDHALARGQYLARDRGTRRQ